ncbi:hypothetical protein Q2Y29_002954 [Vibrio alginolyticus]|nr:hypothetical protein [Vibrio alginolyticus]
MMDSFMRSVLMSGVVLSVSFGADELKADTIPYETPFDEYSANPNPETAFAYLHQVATHPRCANCHGVEEEGLHRPTVGDNRELHPMNISFLNNLHLRVENGEFIQSSAGHAVNCRGCHQDTNGEEPGMPPGAANDLMPGFVWHMPPVRMKIERDMSAVELCELWLDPASNSNLVYRGGRNDMKTFKKEFEHHVKDDPLVRWAWNPGAERSPAPGSHSEFVKAMSIWIDAGAPCPKS